MARKAAAEQSDDAAAPSAAAAGAGGGASSSDAPVPWKRLLADVLLDKGPKGGDVFVDVDEACRGKHVALYFSAHWCPPCRAFTPQLAGVYSKLRKDGVPLEVVFVSMDKSEGQFQEYFQSMPWLAVPFHDDQLRSVLIRKFNVQGIPTLVMLGPDSTVLCTNARAAVARDPNGEQFPWAGEAPGSGSFPVPWILLAFLVFWLLNLFLFPPKPKA